MKLLLHICCAPCATGVIRKLSNNGGVQLTGIYYNPNIHPEPENRARLESVLTLSKDEGFPISTENTMLMDYWKEKLSAEKMQRCGFCYTLRIDHVAKAAKEQGQDAFTTSLLISPWQDHERIKTLCEAAANKYGVDFLYQDFRPFYREGKNEAFKRGYYMQKYCGCIYSYQESDHPKKPVYDL